MFSYKETDFGFAILCPDRNIGGLRGTSKNITRHYSERSQICITSNEADANEMKEMKEFCPTYKGKGTITSLINMGLKKSPTEWVLFVFAGSCIRARMYHKYAYFLENDKDIMFPIVDRKTEFDECSLNGLFMSKKVLKDIGPFDEVNSLNICRLFWALDAIEQGYRFKALMGAKII